MVVDDSRMMELQICKLLEDSEFEVAAYCENGEEAITRYEEIHPDVVTMDIIMPGIDGLETAQIILTDEGTVSEAAGIGAKTFLYKPLTREGLIGALEQALA